MNYYIGNMAVSDELYHHGVQGMHWYQRRYQNPDGTLTPLGKIHYGVGGAAKKVGEGVGKAIKKVTDHQVDKIKRKHPWMMSDEELRKQTDRVRAENTYLSELTKKKQATTTRGQKFAADILESSAKTLVTKGVEAAANKLFSKKESPVRDLEDVLNDTKATASEINAAYKRFEDKKDLEDYKRKTEMEYFKPEANAIDKVDQMSKRELDNYNAWAKSRYGNNKEKSSVEKAMEIREKDLKEKEKKEEADKKKDEANKKKDEEKKRKEQDEYVNREMARIAELRKETERLTGIPAAVGKTSKNENNDNRSSNNSEKKKDAIDFVDRMFELKGYKNYKDTKMYQDAKKRALKLVDNNGSINVYSIFYD